MSSTTKGFCNSFNSSMTRCSASWYSARGISLMVPSVVTHYPYCGVLGNHLPGSHLCRQVKGDFVVKPGSFDHSRGFVLKITQTAGNNVSHTVNEPNVHPLVFRQFQGGSLFWDEFRFGGHNRAPCPGLRKFIQRSIPAAVRFHSWQHQQFHKPLDKKLIFRCAPAPTTPIRSARLSCLP